MEKVVSIIAIPYKYDEDSRWGKNTNVEQRKTINKRVMEGYRCLKQ